MELINTIPATAQKPRLIFLDAHFAGGADFKGMDAYLKSTQDPRSFPLIEELRALAGKGLTQDWIIMDDARLYVDGPFARGECPGWARQWTQKPQLDECLALFAATHDLHVLRQDEGYFILIPKQSKVDLRDVVRVLPGDLPGNGVLQFVPNVPGVTSISIQRRIADHRFATRYFVGNGLDVGGGVDSLALFRDFFPLAQTISRYDMENGDAQLLKNVDDNVFDFLYSSHCLEHLRDAKEALGNWLRIVKPGGHLVVQVPDEDLYEQGQWPSRFNSDHKLTFTMSKPKSWSPVSINVLELLQGFGSQAQIISVGLVDQGYRYSLKGRGIDQTRTPLAECGIEFVLKKL
jgi:SAM-dependent methyltransferase